MPWYDGLEGSNHGHDVISVKAALSYLESKGHSKAVEMLNAVEAPKNTYEFIGSSDKLGSNRNVFGQAVVEVLGGMTEQARKDNASSISIARFQWG